MGSDGIKFTLTNLRLPFSIETEVEKKPQPCEDETLFRRLLRHRFLNLFHIHSDEHKIINHTEVGILVNWWPVRDSNPWMYPWKGYELSLFSNRPNGAHYRARTYNRSVNSRLLCHWAKWAHALKAQRQYYLLSALFARWKIRKREDSPNETSLNKK